MSKGKKYRQEESYKTYFTIKCELGKGGNAIVLLVEDKETGREYALKALKDFSEEKQQRFVDEITILQKCEEERITGVLPVIKSDTEHYWYTMPVATPIVEGLPSKEDKSFASSVVSRIIQLAATLEVLHSRDISHRDIKPGNLYWHEGKACIGDFGLVDFPDKTNNLTRNDRGLGAIFTIAPEMKRNPQVADGKKADVYSLAKTLWMLLSLDEKGFDGQYQYNDNTIRLHSYEHLAQAYLVEIEKLLKRATDNNPDNRPTITDFKEDLIQWVESESDSETAESNEWHFLTDSIFNGRIVKSTSFDDIDEIVEVLNIIGNSPAHNHLLFGEGGGLDFTEATVANEPGCIYLVNKCFWSIVKPKKLYFESFEDSRWNYFLLEASDLQPILDKGCTTDEELVEDTPGHYVSAENAVYGVYDYDTGERLPEGFRHVHRYVRGKFLIVQKTGPYNRMPHTYDGRHRYMSNDELKKYIKCLSGTLKHYTSKGYSEETILRNEAYNQTPYQDRVVVTIAMEADDDQTKLSNGEDFVQSEFQTWNFSDAIDKACEGYGKLDFYFVFNGIIEQYDFLCNTYWYLATDGTIKHSSESDPQDCYIVRNREIAINICQQLNAKIRLLCQGYDIDTIPSTVCFTIRWSRKEMPSYLFTKEEIKAEMQKADDREGNKLVIDEDGYAHVLPFEEVDGTLYPVDHEAWCAYKNYVGKYSSLATLDSTYLNALVCWLEYLKTGQHQYCDADQYGEEMQIIEEIKKYMTKIRLT